MNFGFSEGPFGGFASYDGFEFGNDGVTGSIGRSAEDNQVSGYVEDRLEEGKKKVDEAFTSAQDNVDKALGTGGKAALMPGAEAAMGYPKVIGLPIKTFEVSKNQFGQPFSITLFGVSLVHVKDALVKKWPGYGVAGSGAGVVRGLRTFKTKAAADKRQARTPVVTLTLVSPEGYLHSIEAFAGAAKSDTWVFVQGLPDQISAGKYARTTKPAGAPGALVRSGEESTASSEDTRQLPRKKMGEVLTASMGPLPVWAWASLGIAAGALAYWRYRVSRSR